MAHSDLRAFERETMAMKSEGILKAVANLLSNVSGPVGATVLVAAADIEQLQRAWDDWHRHFAGLFRPCDRCGHLGNEHAVWCPYTD